MHAALVSVTIHDAEPALKFLREEIVPPPGHATIDSIDIREVIAHA